MGGLNEHHHNKPTAKVSLCHIPCTRIPERLVFSSRGDAPASDISPTAKLASSRYGDGENLYNMTKIFDKTTEVRFLDAGKPQYIKFGCVRGKEFEYDIRSGQLKLSG